MNLSHGKKLLTLLAVSIVFAILAGLLIVLCLSNVLSPVATAWSALSGRQTDPEAGSSVSPDESYVDLYSKPSEPSVPEESDDGSSAEPVSGDEPPEDTVKSSTIRFPIYQNKFGEISVDGTSIQNVSLFFGDSKKVLKLGVGMYDGSNFPGMGSTCLISGHNNRDFHALKDVEVGSHIRISTSYGEYVYRVTSCEIRKATDSTAYDLDADYENVILYTCYPFDALGLTNQRYFVYGEYVSGPRILLDE